MKTNIMKYITCLVFILFMFFGGCSDTEMSGDPVVPGTEKIDIEYSGGFFKCDWPDDVKYADLWVYDNDAIPTFPDGNRVVDQSKIVACAHRINVNGVNQSELKIITNGKLTTDAFSFGTGIYWVYILGFDNNNGLVASSPAISPL